MSEVLQPKSSDIEESVRKAVGTKPARWGLESPDELIGTCVDERYTIVERIARGGMGAVFKAIQAPMGRVCAVKVLSATYDGKKDPAFDKRFFREAATISRLRHPNTVTLYDYGNIGDLYYVAMEYVGGRTLHAEIYREGRFEERRARRIAMQICRSLREAHSHGVVHRDLKPDNVLLVDRASETDLVKVLDFGLAKVIEGDMVDDDVTETGLCMGSPKHMAPEQITGDTVSAHTDIYALGILMYEMLTAHSPFDRPTRYQTLVAQVHEEAMSFGELLPDANITAGMERIVMRCLNKERHRRFPSMNELLQAIKELERASIGSMPSVPSIISAIVPKPPQDSRPVMPSAPSVPDSRSSRHSLYPPPSKPSFSPEEANRPSEAPSLRTVGPIPQLPPFSTAPKSRVNVALVVGMLVGVIGIGSAIGASLYTRAPTMHASSVMTGLSSAVPPPATETASAWPVTRMVRVDTEPHGAKVFEGDKALCDKTPCEVIWRDDDGVRALRLELPGYVTSRPSVAPSEKSITVVLVAVGRAPEGGASEAPVEELADDTGYKFSPY